MTTPTTNQQEQKHCDCDAVYLEECACDYRKEQKGKADYSLPHYKELNPYKPSPAIPHKPLTEDMRCYCNYIFKQGEQIGEGKKHWHTHNLRQAIQGLLDRLRIVTKSNKIAEAETFRGGIQLGGAIAGDLIKEYLGAVLEK